jgi:hypothetical protein
MAAKAIAAIGVARRRRENGVMAWRGIRRKRISSMKNKQRESKQKKKSGVAKAQKIGHGRRGETWHQRQNGVAKKKSVAAAAAKRSKQAWQHIGNGGGSAYGEK